MLKKWLKYICDPIDKTNLVFHKITEQKGEDIILGTLKSKSGHIYKIINGVPILLNNFTQSTSSVDSFAYEWNTFDFDYGKKSWINDVIKPIVSSVNYFKNKNVIDCGAGSGRQSLWMVEAGAKFVFAIELSNSATTIVRRVTNKFKNKIFVIQADIEHLPINKNKINIDIAYCVNVIQHTKNPIKSTGEISKLLNKNSKFIFNIYLLRDNKLKIKIIELVKKLLSILSTSSIRKITYIVSIFLYPFWINKHSFKEFWLDVYDLLGTHSYQKFYTEKYLENLLIKSKLKIIKRSYYSMLLKRSNL